MFSLRQKFADDAKIGRKVTFEQDIKRIEREIHRWSKDREKGSLWTGHWYKGKYIDYVSGQETEYK